MLKMKKMLELLNRPKKRKDIFYTEERICKDAVPDPPRNLQHVDIPPRSEMYRNFRFDSCCDESCNTSASEVSYSNGTNSVTSEQEHQLHYESFPSQRVLAVPAEVTDHQNSSPLSESLPLSVPQTSIALQPNLSSRTQHSRTTSSESEGGASSSSELDLETDLSPNYITSQRHVVKKSRKKSNNTYIININDSKGFHIGSKKTINVMQKDNVRPVMEHSPRASIKLQQDEDTGRFDYLLDITDKITFNDISVISLYVNDRWREIGNKLGLEESAMKELEIENEKNTTLIVSDMLRQFLNRFPNTTLGFIVNILKEGKQMKALEQLAASLPR